MDGYLLKPTPRAIDRFIRAMDPWPIAWTFVKTDPNAKEKRLKLIKAHITDKKLVLDEVQLEGKGPVSWEQFKAGYPKYQF